MEGKKLKWVRKVRRVKRKERVVVREENGNVSRMGMDGVKGEVGVGEDGWWGRVWERGKGRGKGG